MSALIAICVCLKIRSRRPQNSNVIFGVTNHVVARVAQNAAYFSATVAVVHVQLFADFTFGYPANHASMPLIFTHLLPLFVSQAIPKLQFFGFTVARRSRAFAFVLLMARFTPCATIIFSCPLIKKLIKIGQRFFCLAFSAYFSHGKNPQPLYIS